MRIAFRVVLLVLIAAFVAAAQTPGDLAAAFSAMRASWTASVVTAMRWIFFCLMALDFCWTGFQLGLESGWTFKEWAATLLKFIMTRGFWAAVMLNASTWMPAIIASLTQIGVTAAGLAAPLSPNDLWNMGLTLAETLAASGTSAAWLTDPAAMFVLAMAEFLIVVSFAAMTATLIMTLAESYMALSVGYLFLGFGGSRWTDSYARNYVNLALGIGTKIMVIYCIISAANKQMADWLAEMKTISTAIAPMDTALPILGGCLVLAACVWMLPKALSAIVTGTLSAHHGDLIAPVATMAGIATMGASLALKGAGLVSAGAGTVGSMVGGGGGGGGKSRGPAPAPPASAPATSRAVPPPPAPSSI